MKREEHTDRSRVLVIDIDGKQTGLLVDGVRQVTRVGRNEFEAPPAAIRNDTADYIDGVVKLDNGARIIIALDARRVCTLGGANGDGDAIAEALAKSSAAPSTHGPKDGPNHGPQGKEALSNGKEAPAKGAKCGNWSVSKSAGRICFSHGACPRDPAVQTPKEVPVHPSICWAC